MQILPYTVLSNDHLSHVYELYYKAFEILRRVPEIKTLEDNDRFCDSIRKNLLEHLTVIPRLIMGVIQVQDYMDPTLTDKFVTTLLRSVSQPRLFAIPTYQLT
jgi:pyruvate dehydrogenase kinase 2/3/4